MKLSTIPIHLLTGLLLSWVHVIPTTAQIIPDDTLPSPSIAPPNCTDCEITGGTQAGRNLFHSFNQFSIPTGGRALFNNAVDIQNIFTRITGRSPSNIDGILQSNGTANLFLLNPNGIFFGRNASLNIGGSFFATTGDRINFADGTQFSTVNPQPSSLLTISTPIGLQIGQNAGSITNRSQASVNGATNTSGLPVGLQVLSGEAIAFIGNGIFFDNGNLTARGGRVELQSIAASSVNLTPFENSYAIADVNSDRLTDIRLANQSNIDTSGELGNIASGGEVQLQGRNIHLTNSSSIISSTYQGIGSNLQFIAADSLTVNRSFAGTLNEGEGKAGNVIIRANNSVNLIGNPRGVLSSQTGQNSSGDAGDIDINTGQLSVRGGFLIQASTSGSGDGGDIRIRSNDLEVKGSNLETVRVGNTDFLTGQSPSGIVSQVGIRSRDNVGDAGSLVIDTRRLTLRNGGFISAATFAAGNSGTLTINALESVAIRGTTSAVTRNQYRSGIYVSSEPGENATGQPIPTTGNVGALTINTNQLTVEDRAEISANNRGTGSAGTATLNVRDLQIRDGGEIRASSLNSGNGQRSGDGGTLFVNAESIQLTGSSIIGSERVPSSLAALTRSFGNAGDLEIITSTLDVLDGAEVSVLGGKQGGAAGTLTITADRINLDWGRLVGSTQTRSGADITLEGRDNLDLLTLQNNSSISARAANEASGGNVRVTAPDGFVIATGTDNDIIANAFRGSGGNITITAQSILGLTEQPFSPNNGTNDIDASSQFAAPGSVTLNQIDPDPSRGTIELPADLVDASRLVSQNCSARGTIARTPSEFVITGRGGLSPSPLEPLNASTTLPHWITPSISTQPNPELQDKDSGRSLRDTREESSHPSPEILEAQGWVRTAQGAIVLTAEAPVTTQTIATGLSCSNAQQ